MIDRFLATGIATVAMLAAGPASAHHHEDGFLTAALGPLLILFVATGLLAVFIARGVARSRKDHEC